MNTFPKTGIGLRAGHFDDILATRPDVGFLEAHSENYFFIDGIPFEYLMKCREHYAVRLHGVGLSLGSADGVSPQHLRKLKGLVKHVEPDAVSDHISWSGVGGQHVPDLLPLPFTREALDIICANIDKVQNELGRKILVENPSSYIKFPSEMTEPEFIAETLRRTGCGLLLDVNNIHVSGHNTGFDAMAYIDALPDGIVGEIHLAGYQNNNGTYIDAHNHKVYDAVWDIYAHALQKFGDVTTLVEWDNDLPALDVLVAEAKKADAIRFKNLRDAA